MALALLASLVLAASASADTVEVNTAVDEDGTGTGCSLREAITAQTGEASFGGCTLVMAPGTNQITFAVSLSGATIDLTEGQLGVDVAGPLEIVGPGMDQLTISGDDASRVLLIDAGSAPVSISGLSVTGGNPAQAGEVLQGGGISNFEDLTLTDVRVAGNNLTAASTVDDVSADGAGIANFGSLTLDHSTIEGNTAGSSASGGVDLAQARGAGIFSDGGTVAIESSEISGNTATATNNSLGTENALAVGGMYSEDDFDVAQSTFSGNSASASLTLTGMATAVGAIYAQPAGTSSLEQSTVAGNLSGPGATVPAGGILGQGGTLAIRSSTIALNGPTSVLTPVDGANLTAFAGVQLTNTILSDPRGGGDNCLDFGNAISSGFTLDFTPGPGFSGSCLSSPPEPTDLTSNPLLSPAGLADNGGPTETIALQPTSPAIDKGSNATDDDTDSDQRGFTRPVEFSGLPNAVGGNGTDIGAFEVQLACAGQATPSSSCSPAVTPPSPPAAKKKCKKKKGKKGAVAAKKCKKKKKKNK